MIRVNHRDELSKRIKYNHLVANCVIFHNVTESNTTQDPQ
ncbi:Tn3 family transposase (plasmid) [Acaryochloris sp. 'Moss Beach']|nr:transposase [Acaryochloris sp. 'Moss Beach']UJB73113.1 Tn3 family transposase [Acaryochloris sp. 'Moss Beach']